MPRVCRYARVDDRPPSRARGLAERLAQRTLELVNIPSESLHEAEVRSHLLSLVPPVFAPEYAAEDAFVFARPRRAGVPLVLLVGHYDTVPAQDNLPGRIADGCVHGCGATDMKGGVAVALEVVRELALGEPGPVDVALLLFGKEELPAQFSPLPELFRAVAPRDDRRPRDPARADRPDDPGGLSRQHGGADHVLGRQRPLGAALDGRERDREGDRGAWRRSPRWSAVRPSSAACRSTRWSSITRLEAGIADNVIPDRAVATAQLPVRTGPHAGERGRLSPLAHARRRRARDHGRFAARGGRHGHARSSGRCAMPATSAFEPKQAWTNVADFTTRGIDAVNFGPGATRYAHRRDELVEIDALVTAYETLHRFLTG